MVSIMIKNSSPSSAKAMTLICLFCLAFSSAMLAKIISTSGTCYKDKWYNEYEVWLTFEQCTEPLYSWKPTYNFWLHKTFNY